ncbi:MAG TPA: hypothetical protein VKT32_03935 [Chthonomonadaceae bacterium]|nr:hypothetical protein [Chthonomonadaceae bacterium]
MRLDVFHDDPGGPLSDLQFVMMEREAWIWAAREAAARPMLAKIYAYHAEAHCQTQRWPEVPPLTRRALTLLSQPEHTPDILLRARLMQAAAAVFEGYLAAPERGLRLLKRCMQLSAGPEYIAWILADMAQYAALSGQETAGLRLGKQACEVARGGATEYEWYLRWRDYARLLLEAGQAEAALMVLPVPAGVYGRDVAEVMLLYAGAYGQVGNRSEAHDWLQRALDLIATHGLERLRPKADALAGQF